MNSSVAHRSLGLSSLGGRSVRLGSLALLGALCAAPAFADTHVYPGTMCHSDNAVDRPTNGALLNTAPGSTSTSKFHCPIVRSQPVTAYGSTLTVSLHAKLNLSSNYDCALRATTANGTVMDSTTVVLPPKTSFNNGFFTSIFSVTLVPAIITSVNLRCNVPNIAGETAGVMSYTVSD